MGRDEAELPAVLQRDQRCPADFASRPGRGRDRDDRHDGRRDPGNAAEDCGIVFERSVMGGEQGDALRKVDRRAAAHRDQAVAALIAIHRQSRLDRLLRRIGRRSGEDRQVAAALHHGGDPADEPGFHHSLVGDDQGLADPQVGQVLLDAVDGAEFETDRRQVGDHRHGAGTG